MTIKIISFKHYIFPLPRLNNLQTDPSFNKINKQKKLKTFNNREQVHQKGKLS